MTIDESGMDDQEHGPRPDPRIAALEAEIARLREALHLEQLKLEQTEAALWQMSVLFGIVPVPVLMMDASGVVTDVNRQAERLFGARREALLGRHLATLVDPERRDRCERALRAVRSGELVRGLERELWSEDDLPGVGSMVLMPITARDGRVVGLALAEDIRELKQEGELLLGVNRELRQLVNVDPLTGLSNRREYEQVLPREIGRAARGRRPLALAMIDVDEFKAFNDTLGHGAGDRCLAAVAAALRGCLHRPGDLVARYGGEEFVALLPGTAAGGALLIAERMRAAVEALGIRHPALGGAGAVTISVGVAAVQPIPGFDGRALQEAADRALYAAKRAGRNRVQVVELSSPIDPRRDPRDFRGEADPEPDEGREAGED
jgi:diguanylate cyclase (GGDEF)-like protein/PAS domain S-box-containing protein